MDSLDLENTSRDVIVFPLTEQRGKDKIPVVTSYLRIGDAADRIPYMGGPRDEAKQPDPCVTVTKAQIDQMSADQKDVLRSYIDTGKIRVIRGNADALLGPAKARA